MSSAVIATSPSNACTHHIPSQSGTVARSMEMRASDKVFA
jgi:hypothetical protein